MQHISFMSLPEKNIVEIIFLRFLGNFLIFLSTFFIIKTFFTPLSSEIRYFVDNSVLKKTYAVTEGPSGSSISKLDKVKIENKYVTSESSQLADFFGIESKTDLLPVDTTFGVVIPRIAANAKVIKDVNSADEAEYLESLKYGVAHAQGTSYPGEGGNVFLFAHSTDYIWNVSTYNAVFYLLYKLEEGDEINIFYDGKRYVYLVSGKKMVWPNEVEHLVNTTAEEQLTLQTCWPPGTTFQRLLVFAKRKST